MFNQTLFDLLIGPTKSREEIIAYGSTGSTYISKMETAVELHWSAFGADGGGLGDATVMVHQYDRGNFYYAHHKMSGYANTTYRDRARLVVANYRDNYLAAAGLIVPAHLLEMKQIALHYAETGDATSLAYLGDVGDWQASVWVPRIPLTPTGPSANTGNWNFQELRNFVRATESQILAYVTGAVSDGGHPSGYPGGVNYLTLAQQCIDRLLLIQWPDYSWRTVDSRRDDCTNIDNNNIQEATLPWYVRPFYVGLVVNVLILYYRTIYADPRIPIAIENWCTYAFTGADDIWISTPDANGNNYAFKYLSHQTFDENTGSPGTPLVLAAPDLNGLIVNGPAFTYNQTGDTLWRDRVDLMMTGFQTTEETYLGGFAGKRFNEWHAFTWEAWNLILSDPVTSSTRTIRLRGV